MTQLGLNYSVDARDRVRLSRQCMALLEWLKRRPITNVEAVMELRVLNATARISELRQAGHPVKATRIEGGLWKYELETKCT